MVGRHTCVFNQRMQVQDQYMTVFFTSGLHSLKHTATLYERAETFRGYC